MKHLKNLLTQSEGATAIEYAIIAAMLSIVIVGTVMGIGSSMNSLYYEKVNDGLNPK